MDPIDFHYHGIDGLDLKGNPKAILGTVEEGLKAEGVRAVLTFGLPQRLFLNFIEFMSVYYAGMQAGDYIHIVGIAIEGPLLTSAGGTPEQGIWTPTMDQWKQISQCGRLGLKYVVISSDIKLPGDQSILDSLKEYPTDIRWITNTLLDGGVLLSLGHFSKANPAYCAQTIHDLLDIIRNRASGPIITDHLFNDMPLNFKHAWRTSEERLRRDADLKEMDLSSWNIENTNEKMGLVPATLLQGAKAGLLKLCLNFDGEHVDLEICKKTVEIAGAKNILIMSDRIPAEISGGERLSRHEDSTLLYQSQGIVAGGSQSITRQIQNMRSIGISDQEIEEIVSIGPSRILKIPSSLRNHISYITPIRDNTNPVNF